MFIIHKDICYCILPFHIYLDHFKSSSIVSDVGSEGMTHNTLKVNLYCRKNGLKATEQNSLYRDHSTS